MCVREHLALSALLEALPEPVLSVDMKSKVDMANPASCQLFGQKLDRLRNHTAAQLINGFNFLRWLESEPQDSHNEHVVINGQNFLMEITPVYLQDENDQHVLTGAVVILTGIVGNLLAESVYRWFGITDPIAKGVGIGTAAHAVGTSKALQMGEVEGAMSGLSIAVAGVLTAVLCPIFANLI